MIFHVLFFSIYLFNVFIFQYELCNFSFNIIVYDYKKSSVKNNKGSYNKKNHFCFIHKKLHQESYLIIV